MDGAIQQSISDDNGGIGGNGYDGDGIGDGGDDGGGDEDDDGECLPPGCEWWCSGGAIKQSISDQPFTLIPTHYM